MTLSTCEPIELKGSTCSSRIRATQSLLHMNARDTRSVTRQDGIALVRENNVNTNVYSRLRPSRVDMHMNSLTGVQTTDDVRQSLHVSTHRTIARYRPEVVAKVDLSRQPSSIAPQLACVSTRARHSHAGLPARPRTARAPMASAAYGSGMATQRVFGRTRGRVTTVGKVICTVGSCRQYPPGAGPTHNLSPQVSQGGASDGALAPRATEQGYPVSSTVQQPQI
jgi:hypothetical protein